MIALTPVPSNPIPEQPAPAGASILIIEDDAGDYGLVEAEFQHIRLGGDSEPHLTWAKTLSEGLAAAREALPDVVLLDLSLPDSFGVATLKSVIAVLP
jgi:DNA-binding response OmpR family regulator